MTLGILLLALATCPQCEVSAQVDDQTRTTPLRDLPSGLPAYSTRRCLELRRGKTVRVTEVAEVREPRLPSIIGSFKYVSDETDENGQRRGASEEGSYAIDTALNPRIVIVPVGGKPREATFEDIWVGDRVTVRSECAIRTGPDGKPFVWAEFSDMVVAIHRTAEDAGRGSRAQPRVLPREDAEAIDDSPAPPSGPKADAGGAAAVSIAGKESWECQGDGQWYSDGRCYTPRGTCNPKGARREPCEKIGAWRETECRCGPDQLK